MPYQSQRTRPAPLAPRPENWYKIKEVVGLYGAPLDKYGRFIPGAPPIWTLMPRWAKMLYRELAELGGREGNISASLAYIGFDLMQVTSERARQQLRAMINWGFIERCHRPGPHGWFETNRYALVNPLAPKHLIAIAVRTFDRHHPIEIIHLSQQVPPATVPDFFPHRKREVPARRPAPVPAAPAHPPRTVVLSERFRNLATGLGLVDPRHQYDAWNRYLAQKAAKAAKGRHIEKPGAYWTGIVRNVVQELRDAMEAAAEGHKGAHVEMSPDQADSIRGRVESELHRRRSWLVAQAYMELMEGYASEEAAARIFARPQLHHHCTYSPCSLDEVLEQVQRAAATLSSA